MEIDGGMRWFTVLQQVYVKCLSCQDRSWGLRPCVCALEAVKQRMSDRMNISIE
jgi:hypothetical protein